MDSTAPYTDNKPNPSVLVDEKALYYAVADRLITGTAIDTWYEYPVSSDDSRRPSKYPLCELGNVIMTPHHPHRHYRHAGSSSGNRNIQH